MKHLYSFLVIILSFVGFTAAANQIVKGGKIAEIGEASESDSPNSNGGSGTTGGRSI